MSHQKILILDFGSQVTQLIARRVREQQVYCELHPFDVSEEFIRNFKPKGIILSGGPNSVYEALDWKAPQVVFELGVPVLGICYGMQTMAQQLGGKVEPGKREFGYAESPRPRPFSGCSTRSRTATNAEGHGLLDVWMSHGDKVTELPAGFKVIGSNESCPVAAMADEERGFYAVQFHPEVTHTLKGREHDCPFRARHLRLRRDWNMPDYVNEAIARVRAQVGEDEVILGLSGGVDSSVVAALLHKAIGDQLTCVFVDNGLLRLNEGDAGHADIRPQPRRQGHPRRCHRAVHGPPEGRFRPGGQAQDHRPRIRRSLPGRSSQAAQEPNGWPRARSIRMSSNRPAPRPARRMPSRAITTSAACRKH
jgi:GMP synthase (glutamine-hydrolysing)